MEAKKIKQEETNLLDVEPGVIKLIKLSARRIIMSADTIMIPKT
jgi:hypothetical protein